MTRSLISLTWLLVAAFALLRVRIIADFDVLSGFDAYSHIDYLELAAQGVWPESNHLWQAYHPPGYYFTSALIARILGTDLISTGQFVAGLSGLLAAIPVYWLARRYVPGWESAAVLVFVSLPCLLRVTPMVYGMLLATALFGGFTVFLTRSRDTGPNLKIDLMLGLTWGLAVMVRFDGLMLALPVVLLWLERVFKAVDRKAVRDATISAVIVSTVAFSIFSILLLRNLNSQNVLLLTARHPYLYEYPQYSLNSLPGFSAPIALIDPGLRVWLEPASSHFESIPGTLFLRMWGENLDSVLPVQIQMLGGLYLCLLAIVGLPSVGREWLYRPVAWVALGNVVLMTLFLLKHPDHTNYKAAYFHGALFLFSLSAVEGARWSVENLGAKAKIFVPLPALVILLRYFV